MLANINGDNRIANARIKKKYLPTLKKNGVFIFEIGYDQADDLKKIAKKHNLNCEIFKDYGGCDRVAILSRERPTAIPAKLNTTTSNL